MDIFYIVVSLLLIGLGFIDKYYWSSKRFNYINEIIRSKDATIELLKQNIINSNDLSGKVAIIEKFYEIEKINLEKEKILAINAKDVEKQNALSDKLLVIKEKETKINELCETIDKLKSELKNNETINKEYSGISYLSDSSKAWHEAISKLNTSFLIDNSKAWGEAISKLNFNFLNTKEWADALLKMSTSNMDWITKIDNSAFLKSNTEIKPSASNDKITKKKE
jgi:hypothetical protein